MTKLSGTNKHTCTYQISTRPPAFRAIETSSFPYFSSANALQKKNKKNNQQKNTELLVALVQLTSSGAICCKLNQPTSFSKAPPCLCRSADPR